MIEDMDRRQALFAAIRLVGGGVALGALPASAYEGTIAAPGAAGHFFTAGEMALLAAVATTVIPATDTPSAGEVNVQGVIDGLMVDWAVPATRAQFRAALAAIDKAAGGNGFTALDPTAQADWLARWDAQAFAGDDPDYRRLKQLIFYAYFTAEGADPDYVRIPGAYHGDLSLAEYRHLVAERRE